MKTTLDQHPPVFIVSGPNWECEIETDEEDMGLGLTAIDHMIEAATKALEIAKGVSPSDKLTMLDDDGAPYLGSMVLVHHKDAKPEDGQFIPSFIPLGNAGFYKESREMFLLYNQEMSPKQEQQPKKRKPAKKKQNNKSQKVVKPSKKKTRNNKNDLR